MCDPIYDQGLGDDFENRLLRVQGFVRILEDQVQPSAEGPHLNGLEAPGLTTPPEQDLRGPTRCRGGHGLYPETPEGSACPDSRSQPAQVGRGWRPGSWAYR